MAQRVKTIEFAAPASIASVATAVARNFTAFTAYAPETTSRTIRSAHLEFACMDNVTTAASVTAVNMSVQIDAVGASAATVTTTFTNSGENCSYVWIKDVTAYFVTNFTGASHSITCAMTVTGVATINANVKLVLTYEYSDTSATTRIKTVKIPIDGNTGVLTTTYANLGGVASQIPNLSTFLPESSKVYRSIFFEWLNNTNKSAAGASTLDISYDGGTTTVSDTGLAQTDLNSATFYRRIDVLTGTLNTSAAGSVQAKVSTTATHRPMDCMCGVLVVTYEYDHSASTTIMNSIQMVVTDEIGLPGGTATGDKSRWKRTISVQEPTTITLVQSGILLAYNSSGAITVDFRVGSQATRSFVQAASARCGGVTLMRRIDSGGAGGVAGMTLGRGFNDLVLDWFTTSAAAGSVGSNLTGCLFLNYTSGKHASGDGVHNHTTQWVHQPLATGFTTANSMSVQVTPATVPSIPEADYYLGGAGYQLWATTCGTAAGSVALAVLAEVQSGEAEGAGWRSVFGSMVETDAEAGVLLAYGRARDDFKRWPLDPEARLDIETSRSYRFQHNLAASTSLGVIWQSVMFITHHSITYAIAGTVTGSAGGTVTIDAHPVADAGSVDAGDEIANTSRVGNGAYSVTWYDNTVQVYTEARESGVLLGRSDNAVAV